jgi:hypothetical protein
MLRYYHQYSTDRTEEDRTSLRIASLSLRFSSKLKLCHLWVTSSIIKNGKHKVGGREAGSEVLTA